MSGYTPGMKTAISIPDDVFQEAERVAAELKQSRSQLYSRAVREYVTRHSVDKVTAALDAVYATEPDESELEFLRLAAQRTLERSEW
jgi:metal-responsive CopG/Arc/MetJ family transcriptional regulator